MSRRADLSLAFAKQARAEFDARNILAIAGVADCIQLHMLQMACEKLCKAYLYTTNEAEWFGASHGVIAQVLPIIARQQLSQLNGPIRYSATATLAHIRQLSREIELLQPAVEDGGRRPENCEYPWEETIYKNDLPFLVITAPVDYTFPNLYLLGQRSGVTLLSIIDAAIDALVHP